VSGGERKARSKTTEQDDTRPPPQDNGNDRPASGVIRWGEDGATTIAYSCIFLIIWDLLFLLEYMSVLHEMDHEGEDEE
jgi:hypothetical protein